jgi:hypothetical protein
LWFKLSNILIEIEEKSMLVDLDKLSLISLICSIDPTADQIKELEGFFGHHYFYLGFEDRWEWDRKKLDALKEENLWKLYLSYRDKNWEEELISS